jgi:hypothetical protein
VDLSISLHGSVIFLFHLCISKSSVKFMSGYEYSALGGPLP